MKKNKWTLTIKVKKIKKIKLLRKLSISVLDSMNSLEREIFFFGGFEITSVTSVSSQVMVFAVSGLFSAILRWHSFFLILK
jgi:hypothetical protein